MKKFILPVVMLALLSFTVSDSKLTNSERKAAAEHMAKTRDHMLKTVKGLSEAQLNFKSSAESWSIAECVEHITLSENMIFGMQQGALKTPTDAPKPTEGQMKDEQIIGMMIDRSHKVKTREPLEPTSKFGSHKATVKEFKILRKEHIKYVKKTEDDLRNHYQQMPFGTIDAYQILLFMSAHTERHVLQIEEVLADENFPKE